MHLILCEPDKKGVFYEILYLHFILSEFLHNNWSGVLM